LGGHAVGDEDHAQVPDRRRPRALLTRLDAALTKGRYMTLAHRVLRHLWTSSCLLVAFAACGRTALPVAPVPTAYYESAEASAPPPGYAPAEAHGSVVAPVPERPGLGTSWGEALSSPIAFVPFSRAASTPWAELALHYNDADGVRAHAAYLGAYPQPLEVLAGGGELSVSLVDEAGRILPGFTAGGRSLVMGEDGQRYRIVVRNSTPARFEVVASVDGLDVLDGRPADPNRRGYVVAPYGTLVIDGFRTSSSAVAAFRFGRVAESYAAQTSGDRNVGVIGIALFAERGAEWTPAEIARRDSANPFPSRGYAAPPR
jgi:hypothetical protein